MSRIEIPIQEYNALKDKIKSLEETLTSVSKEASLYKEKLGKIESLVNDLEEENVINRLLFWKNVIKPFKIFVQKNC